MLFCLGRDARNHLGTPQALTGSAGGIAWRGDYSPFGQAATTGSLTFNLRFPGQYFDAETGLHYNWHRYYDPSTGRYITSDPIGLAGGINTYAYVGGSPLLYIDPVGLVRWGAAGSATLGLFGNGAGAIVGTALIAAPEPVSKALGAVVLSKSIGGWGLNWYNLTRAFSDDAAFDAPSSLPRAVARTIAPCSREAERIADALELAVDLAAGRAPVAFLPQWGSALDRPAAFSEVAKYDYRRFGQPPINKATTALQVQQGTQYAIDAYSENQRCGCN